MGKLYDLKLKIENVIKEKNLDEFKLKGEIGLKSGIFMGILNENTPDDETKYNNLKKAAESVLNTSF